ncbi:hybrid sensor histidine kinase/response regulator [Anaeromyxobacter oryzae]|uniref:histidine kinase n=1 Tax=Anaeromyxobacter oryzae TaxID=2918170 RepID=A0ABM7WXR3_9BACT|nr:ATP-binding protein [Anaeromyxobacter oryzae]BDG04262.1 hybrid sensor histidine kinase/response regulator [Anaeromyxobacter oryzae]
MGISEEIRQKLLPRFRETTADRVEKISGALLEVERGAATKDVREELARELHTLKGEARMMGFVGISSVVHAAEELLKGVPEEGPSAGDAVDALLKACDAIVPMLDAPVDGGDAARILAERLRALVGGAPAPAAPPAEKPAAAAPAPAPRPEQPTQTSAGLKAVAPAGHHDEAPKAELRGDRPAASIRVDVDRLDEIAALAGDVLVEGARAIRRSRDLNGLFARWARLSDRVIALAERVRDPRNARLVEQIEGDVHLLRSDTFRFARHQTEAASTSHAQFGVLAERIGAARLIPLSGVLAGFPRAVRDMAKEQGKEVECVVKGAETGVDKAILLSLNDPLVHLVRNCVDHGIEAPADRLGAGKPRAGRVVISARTDGDLLAVTVEDDGRGVSPIAVRAAALRKGIIGEQQAASLSARAALDLIFMPGFSTREQAGETSGRGVGLDVVRKRVTSLGGSVTVESEPGKGAKFTLRMPQSLSLMKVLLVRIDDDVYGIPAVDVDSVGRLDPKEITEVAGIRAVRYRGRLMPVVALGPLLSLNGGPRSQRPMVAYVSHGSEGAAVVVDGLFGEREVAVKAPGQFLKGMRFVTGAAALEDGRVALLLSTPDIVAAARRLASPAVSRGRDRRRLRILLVDDSAIAREAEAALLRSLGHEVDEAVDGEDGWQKLQSGQYHLLVSDVQMPVLDGIDLTRRVKSTPRFVKLPIVIMSSLSAPEERRRGVDAGADAYMVKGELEAENLAGTLERLCGVGG